MLVVYVSGIALRGSESCSAASASCVTPPASPDASTTAQLSGASPLSVNLITPFSDSSSLTVPFVSPVQLTPILPLTYGANGAPIFGGSQAIDSQYQAYMPNGYNFGDLQASTTPPPYSTLAPSVIAITNPPEFPNDFDILNYSPDLYGAYALNVDGPFMAQLRAMLTS